MALPPSFLRSRSTTSAEKKCRRSKHILPGMQLPEPQKKNSTRRPNGSAGAVGTDVHNQPENSIRTIKSIKAPLSLPIMMDLFSMEFV